MGDNKENLGKQEQSGNFAHVRFHVLESQRQNKVVFSTQFCGAPRR